jgi:hypothetical protein
LSTNDILDEQNADRREDKDQTNSEWMDNCTIEESKKAKSDEKILTYTAASCARTIRRHDDL